MPEIRLLVVDDHQQTREAIVQELSSGGLIRVAGEAKTSDEALKIARELLPDLVLLDLHLPGLLGTTELIKKMTALRNVKVVLFASEAKLAEVQPYLAAGAHGYMLKTDNAVLLRMALLMVSRGSRNIISPALPRYIIGLSIQERALLAELARPGNVAKIAQRLGISPENLTAQANSLAAKFELKDIEQLRRWTKKNGF